MRKILFRGKRIDNGEWAKGYLVSAVHEDIKAAAVFIVEHNPTTGFSVNEFNTVLYDTIGQYTGYRDKHGTMIFEGDILKAPDEKNYNLCVVEWNEKYAAFVICGQLKFIIDRYDDIVKPQMEEHTMVFGQKEYFEIISNIHDNPELIN